MDETRQPETFGDDDLDRLLFDLVMRSGARVEERGPAGAVVRLGLQRAALVRYLPGREDQLRERLALLMSELSKRTATEFLLVGGPADARKLLADCRPVGLRKQLLLYHRAEDGTLWNPNGFVFSRPLGKHLKRHPIAGPASQSERDEFAARLAQMEQQSAGERRELQSFSTLMAARRPVCTWVLAASIAAAFVLQWLFGGTESSPVLARMGALIPERVAQGEWWRLLASSFLHAGPLHFGLNLWVLLMVGGSLERILGGARMLAIYGLSALGASLASLAFSDASLTVGASGGIWGLLAAEAVLVWRPRGLLPEAVQQSARQNVVVNVAINVANSLRPNVAMAAHFGGGAVGALLLAGGFLLRGLPSLAQVQSGEPTRASDPRWLRPLAFANVALLLASLGAGVALGRGWELKAPPALERRTLAGLGLSGELPVGFAQQPAASARPDAELTAVFGDLVHDGSVVVTSVFPFPNPIPAGELEAEVAGLVDQLGRPPEEAVVERKPAAATIGGRSGVTVTYAYGNGMKEERAFSLLDDRLWRVDVVCWPGLDERCEGLAKRIADSLKAE